MSTTPVNGTGSTRKQSKVVTVPLWALALANELTFDEFTAVVRRRIKDDEFLDEPVEFNCTAELERFSDYELRVVYEYLRAIVELTPHRMAEG